MKETPQWEIKLLATWPRPVAIILIIVERWLRKNIYDIIGSFIMLFALSTIVIAYVLWYWTGAGIVIGFWIAFFIAAYAYDSFTTTYNKVDESLPKREKKDEE